MSLYRSKARHTLFFFFKYVFIWLLAFETYSKKHSDIIFFAFLTLTNKTTCCFCCCLWFLEKPKISLKVVPEDTQNDPRKLNVKYNTGKITMTHPEKCLLPSFGNHLCLGGLCNPCCISSGYASIRGTIGLQARLHDIEAFGCGYCK